VDPGRWRAVCGAQSPVLFTAEAKTDPAAFTEETLTSALRLSAHIGTQVGNDEAPYRHPPRTNRPGWQARNRVDCQYGSASPR